MPNVARPRPDGQPRGRAPARPSRGSCRLILSIDGTAYAVRPIAADPSVALRAFRLRKPDGTVYHVALHEHGPECDCPDFVFRRDGLDPAGCKHIRAMIASGLLPDEPSGLAYASADEWPAWTDSERWTVL